MGPWPFEFVIVTVVPISVAPFTESIWADEAAGKFVRPPVRLRVPDCTSTVPALLNRTCTDVALFVDFLNVPLLMNVDGAPPPSVIDLSFWASNVPWLLKTAPLAKAKPWLVLAQVAVWLLARSIVRPLNVAPPAMLIVMSLAKMVPAPTMSPPNQPRNPSTVRSPTPPNVPGNFVNVVVLESALKLAVPLKMK